MLRMSVSNFRSIKEHGKISAVALIPASWQTAISVLRLIRTDTPQLFGHAATLAVNPASRLPDKGKRPAALHQGDGQRCSYSDLQLQQYAVACAVLWRSNSRLIIFDDSTLNVDFAIKRFPVG
jgi:hypothetical protein